MNIRKKGFLFVGLVFICEISTAEGKECPYPEMYIEIDRAYHQCINGYVKKGESCDLFVNNISVLFQKYDCKRSFDSVPVPAIWLFDAASEDYIRLIYEMASKTNRFSDGKWFLKEMVKAKEIFLSSEFKSVLDGYLAEEYYPLIEEIRNAP